MPTPRYVQVRAEDYVAVPFFPRPPPVEIVPLHPSNVSTASLVWADGSWEWGGERFRWSPGAWVVPPAGAKRARWVIVRRKEDGQLFFAPSSWRDAEGRPIEPPTPLVKVKLEPGGAAGAGELTAPGGVRTDLDD